MPTISRQTFIQLYSSAKDNTGQPEDLGTVLDRIATDSVIAQKQTALHLLIAAGEEKKVAAFKQSKLEGVCFSGTFSKRHKAKCTEYSHLIVIDLDHLPDPVATREIVTNEGDFTPAIAFISPSGKGLKLVYLVSTYLNQHEQMFWAISNFLKATFDLTVDPSGKDCSRLCFLPSDPDVFIDLACAPVSLPFMAHWNPTGQTSKVKGSKKKSPAPAPVETAQGPELELAATRTFTDRIMQYNEGNRNNYIHQFACNCNRAGISLIDCLQYVLAHFSDYPQAEAARTVESGYSAAQEHGRDRAKMLQLLNGGKTEAAPGTAPVAPAPNSPFNEEVLFWKRVPKTVKQVVDPKTGEVKEIVTAWDIKFDHDGYTFFLANNGYRRLLMGEGGHEFVRLRDGLLESVKPEDLHGFVHDYLHKDVKAINGVYTKESIADELAPVRAMFKRGSNTYSKPTLYASLPGITISPLRDTRTHTIKFFANGLVKVTADSISIEEYSENSLDKVWRKQVKAHNLTLISTEEIYNSDAYRFFEAAIIGNGKKNNMESFSDSDLEKLRSIHTTIGYLLCTHKDPVQAKVVILQDRKINTGNDSHGGSGKTLTAHMLSKLVATCLLDGKTFSFQAPYPYDLYRPDQKLIVYNDVGKRFPFDMLFHRNNETFQYDKRYTDTVEIPFTDSPKHCIITNYSILGHSTSYKRRQHIIEFGDYFTDEYDPMQEFGHRLFDDWDEAEWNRFYNFLLYCIKSYKKHGLRAFPAQNARENQLIATTGETFVEWIDGMFLGEQAMLAMGTRLKRDDMFSAFISDCREYSRMENTNKFTAWVRLWAEARGLEINAHCPNGKDKSGSVYYWTFTRKN